MLAIAQHAAIVGLEPLTLKNVANQVRLVLKAAAKLVAIGRLKMALKVEVAKDPLGVDEGFAVQRKRRVPPPRKSASVSFTPS